MYFNLMDQTQLFNPDECPPIHIVGAGGATNTVISVLATMGVREIHVYDADRLKPHNGAGEPMYSDKDIDKPKIEAAINTVQYLRSDNNSIIPHEVFIDETAEFDGIVISGVDSMKSREKIWAAVKNSPLVPLYIDFRLTGDSLTTIVVDPSNDDNVYTYEHAWLHSDVKSNKDAYDSYIAFFSGAMAGYIVARYVDNGPERILQSDEIAKTIRIDTLFNPDECPPIHIVGAGGATNTVISVLATMGVREIHVYDADRLKPHNGAGEPMYSDKDIDKPKIEAAINTVQYLRSDNNSIIPHEVFIDETAEFDGIVISGVDSMKSREKIWAAVKNSPLVPLYIDFRSTGKSLTFLVVDPHNKEDVSIYEHTWMYSDAEATKDVCGARNIPYIAFFSGAIAGYIVARYVDNGPERILQDMGIEKTIYFKPEEEDPFEPIMHE